MSSDLPTAIPASHAAPPVSRILAPFVLLLAATAIGAWVNGLGADVRQWRLDQAIIAGDRGVVSAALEANDTALLQAPDRTLALALAADQPEVVALLLERPEFRTAATGVAPFAKAIDRLSPRLFRFLLEQGFPLPATATAGLARAALTDHHLLPRRGDENERRLELIRILHGRGAFSSLTPREIRTLLDRPDMADFAAILQKDATMSRILGPQPTPPASTPLPPWESPPAEPTIPADSPPFRTAPAPVPPSDPLARTPSPPTPPSGPLDMPTPAPAPSVSPAVPMPGEATAPAAVPTNGGGPR